MEDIFKLHELIGFPLVFIFLCVVGWFVCSQWRLHTGEVAT